MARTAQSAELPPTLLSERDRRILADLARVRLLTGRQLERLHFTGLATSNARGSARRRSLGRLVAQRWVTTLPRRVGGERAGSAGLIYALDARAHRERPLWDTSMRDTNQRPMARIRRPWAIGWMFVGHSLDVAELYVQLREAERVGQLAILTFDAEPAAWFSPDGRSLLKPDAHLVIDSGGWERHWWMEVDRATESLPTLRRKLARYVELYEDQQTGPDAVLPRVLITVPSEQRAAGARLVVDEITRAAPGLISVALFDDAISLLPGEDARPPP